MPRPRLGLPLTSARVSVGTVAPDVVRPSAPSAPASRVRAVARDPATAAVVAFTALAAVLRFVRIGPQGFWFDEADTAHARGMGDRLGARPRHPLLRAACGRARGAVAHRRAPAPAPGTDRFRRGGDVRAGADPAGDQPERHGPDQLDRDRPTGSAP